MIKIDETLIKHLEALAAIELTPEQRKSIEKDMREILAYMELLNEVNVSLTEPMYTPIENPVELREDIARESDCVDLIKSNFPKERSGHIVVPGIHA
ncbi:Asp-tRNA(Asn)/Glu-tRNA(Gln) amidotransferase subunit GatC [Thermotoga profunda]|uniref:Asp-tRNA(Asn)/Glu-tRNA(Gln) amidotransferase subunit GatC n=1 Tax=Thermotoga profunda TaxID=1508420 RepID=UPI000596BFB3|nr:Asp-tRNA(Asn)/Glu-tRNA(Gln) amidotransferase subunit GatC [Thermotoga profunda]